MPDNSGYYHAAYIVATVIYLTYAVGLYFRLRRMRHTTTSPRRNEGSKVREGD
jgi:Ca2+/H+ antiporter